MKLAGLVFVLSIVMCVTDLAHSEDLSHFYLRAACKLMESRDFKTGNSIGTYIQLYIYIIHLTNEF